MRPPPAPGPAFREGVNVLFPGTEEIQKVCPQASGAWGSNRPRFVSGRQALTDHQNQREPGLVFAPTQTYRLGMKSLAVEAEVDSQGWLNIHAPAPPGTRPGKLDAVLVWAPPGSASAARPRPRAGTLPGKVELSADFHAPLEDFRAYSE